MALINSPQHFKPGTSSLTEFRIELVLKYVVHCYLLMQEEGKKYDYNERGKIAKEDFLRDGLVDDYLSKTPNRNFYKNFISDNPNVEIYFQKEEKQNYLEQNKPAEDFIDITVKETELSKVLSEEVGDEIKFTIECKRIKENRDYAEYVKDIHKFTSRPFKTYRLPYEGQIAFIENPDLNHSIVSGKINERLKSDEKISTVQLMKNRTFHRDFDGSYHSIHKRDYGNHDKFSIFHLLFNYSIIVIN